MINHFFKKSVLTFGSIALVAWAINFVLIQFVVLKGVHVVPYWWMTYVFLVSVSILGFWYVAHKVKQNGNINSTGKDFILILTVKILLSIAFLLPWLIFKDESSRPMVIQFFSIFFLFLAIEITLVVKLLQSFPDEKKKNEENQFQKM